MVLNASRHVELLPPVRARNQRETVLVACLSIFVVMSSMSSLNTAVPAIASDTGATQYDITWLVDGYTLALAALVLVGGALCDRFGRRRLLVVGLIAFAIVSLGPALSEEPGTLIGVRVAAGVAAAVVLPSTLAMITATLEEKRRAVAVAIWAVACVVSGGVGLVMTGVLLEVFAWPAVFYASGVMGVVTVALAPLASESRAEKSPARDLGGSVLSIAAVGGVVYGVLRGPVDGWTNPAATVPLALGLAAAPAFVWWERRQDEPLLDVQLFRRARFAAGALSLFVQFAVVYALLFVGVQVLQSVHGQTPVESGLTITAIALPLIPAAIAASWLERRFGMRLVNTVAMSALAGGCAVLAFAGDHFTVSVLLTAILAIGFGIGLSTPIATTAIVESVGVEQQGVASAVNDAVREIGAALGVALSGSLLTAGYSAQVSDHLGGVPAEVRGKVRAGLEAALRVAGQIGDGSVMIQHARTAFLGGVNQAFLGLLIVVVSLSIVLVVISPNRSRARAEPVEADATG